MRSWFLVPLLPSIIAYDPPSPGPRTSERTITSYMKEYRELWNGSQLAYDVGLIGGDWEMAGAIWRNLFDARGWDLPDPLQPGSSTPESSTLPQETQQGSSAPGSKLGEREGIEQPPLESLPYNIYQLTAFVRRELKRLEDIPDEEIFEDIRIGGFTPMSEGSPVALGGSGNGVGGGGSGNGTAFADGVMKSAVTSAELARWRGTQWPVFEEAAEEK